MKTILVMGANGFVGSHALEFLQTLEGVKIIAGCRDTGRLPRSFHGEIRAGDVRDDTYLERLLDGVDTVVNAMAWTSLWKHRQESRQLFLDPTLRLVDRFLRSDAQRYVNISTTSAAAPERSADPMSRGIPRPWWPHLCNLIQIENYIREHARSEKTMVNMRLGIFVGERYGLGLLPILLPRLKTQLVPRVGGGRTRLPLIDGRDVGRALGLAATTSGLNGYESFNVVGKSLPRVHDIMDYLHQRHGYPRPHFGVPFFAAYAFAGLMEHLDSILPWEPLIVRSIVHLLEETGVDNDRAIRKLGYSPQHDWRESIDRQLAEMTDRQQRPMSMARPVT